MQRVIDFFVENFPTVRMAVCWGPVAVVWAGLCLTFAGWLKRRWAVRTGYTRKVFHFLIFFSVAGMHAVAGSRFVCLFGVATSLVVFYAVLRGNGHLLL